MFHAVLSVNFSQVQYSFNEGLDDGSGAAQVQLMLSNLSSFNILVYVMTNNITAIGVNNGQCMELNSENDYLHGVYTATFLASTTLTFVDIPICNDIVLEVDEMFNISIVSNSDPDHVQSGTPDHVTVTIVDNDGKHYPSVDYMHSCQFLSPYPPSSQTSP